MRQVKARVVAVGEHIGGLHRPHGRSIMFSQTIRLNCPEIASVCRPGQFVMVNCGQDCVLPRPFSVHQVVDGQDITLYFAVLEGGKGTDWLSGRRVNDTVEIFGPLGNGFSVRSGARNLLLVAGGMGVACLLYLGQEMVKQGHSVTLLYGTAVKNPYPGKDLTSGMTLITVTEDGSVGRRGRVIDLLPEYASWADQVFACGPLPMYRSMATCARELVIEGKDVQVSLEMRMGCGVGVCYGCTIRTTRGLRQACKDGPVFRLDDIVWDELTRV